MSENTWLVIGALVVLITVLATCGIVENLWKAGFAAIFRAWCDDQVARIKAKTESFKRWKQ